MSHESRICSRINDRFVDRIRYIFRRYSLRTQPDISDHSPIGRPKATNQIASPTMADEVYNYDDASSTDSEPFDDPPVLRVSDDESEPKREDLVAVAHPIDVKRDAFAPDAVEAMAPATHCSKCSKRLLTEVAAAALALENKEAYACKCCGLTLPWFCYTKQQLEAAEPACRGCRGLETVFELLVARARKLIESESGQSVPTLDAVAPKRANCQLCEFPLMRVDPAQQESDLVLLCSCCERELPIDFFSNSQYHKADLRRCRGCLGHERGGKRGDTTYTAWRAKFRKQRKAALGTKDQTPSVKTIPIIKTRSQKAEGVTEEEFRIIVYRYKQALLALERRRTTNDLRGLTPEKFEEKMALKKRQMDRRGERLQKKNPVVFDDIMKKNTKRASEGGAIHGQNKKRKQEGTQKKADASSTLQSSCAGEAMKPHPSDYVPTPAGSVAPPPLVVTTRSRRREIEVVDLTESPRATLEVKKQEQVN